MLLAKLPELATREWATRKVRIAKEAEVLSKRLEAQRSMQQREAQIAELDREKSTFEELTKRAKAQVLNLAQSWMKAGTREKQELQRALREAFYYFRCRAWCDRVPRRVSTASCHASFII